MSEDIYSNYLALLKNEQVYVESTIEDYLTNPQLTLAVIAEHFNEKYSWNYDRKAISTLRKKLGYPARDKSIESVSRGLSIRKRKSLGKTSAIQNLVDTILSQYTKEEFQEEYNKTSINQLSDKFEVTAYRMGQALESLGIQKKQLPKTVNDLIKELENKGYTRETIEALYNDKEISMNDFVKKVNEIIDYRDVSYRQCAKLLRLWGIRKTEENRKYLQGQKSRDEYTISISNLHKAGFKDLQEVTDFYEKNVSLTKNGLVDYLNESLNENTDRLFTVRWTERHIDPLLSADRLKGVSRVENSLHEFLLPLLADVNIVRNTRQLIAPYEVDFYIPDLCVAIELNGNYWHSDKFLLANHGMTSVEYHTMKKQLCAEQGIDLLFVWEFDWEYARGDVEQALTAYFESNEKHAILEKMEYESLAPVETGLKKELFDFLYSLDCDFTDGLVGSDICFPEKSIAIRYNTLVHHTEANGRGRSYHREIWQHHVDKGIQLITVWEDDYRRNPDLVHRMLLHKLGLSAEQRVYARKTVVDAVSNAVAKEFYSDHHIQGNKNGEHYGLFEGDKLVACSTWQKHGDKVYLERYATSCVVVGGFSKVMKHMSTLWASQGIEKIVTFADHEVSDGGLYEQHDFVVDKVLPPDYSYWYEDERKHKFGFRKDKFKKSPELLFEEGLTEKELATLNGIPRIWDAGKTRYVKFL